MTLETTSAAGASGDLTVTNAISKTAGASSTLTFNAVRDLTINAIVSATTGALPLLLNAGRNLSNSQSLTSNGGNITLNPAQTFTLGAAVNAGTGQVSIQSGSVESTAAYTITGSSVQVASTAALRLRGTITGPLTVAGTVSPAPAGSAGSLQVNGAVTLQSTATTVLDLGGTSQGSTYDRINATGAVAVDGELQVSLVNNFHDTISGSTVFNVVQGSSLTGTFTGYPNGSRFILVNDYGSLRINYTATAVTLDDWKPVIVDLTWDPGNTPDGSEIFSNTNTRAGRHYFRLLTQGTDIGAWRTRLTVASGDAALYMSKTTLPLTSGSPYSSVQAGQMLVVPTVLGTGTNAYFLSVVAPQGENIGLDSRIQTVTDIAFNSTTASVAVADAPYRVYRTTVPIDQLAWDVSTTALSGNPNLCVRKNNVPGEWDNEGLSEAPGSTTDSVTLVPDFLTNGTWFITVYGVGAYSFTLKSGNPVTTPLNFTDLKTNDQTNRAGWWYYALTDIPPQVGALGWELLLAGQIPGTQIALRRNKVPGRWLYRANGNVSTPLDTNTQYMDYFGNTGFLQRPGHQADVWYVGIYTPQQALGAFTLDAHPMVPATVGFDGSNAAVTGLEPGRWKFQRVDVPAGVLGWEVRLSGVTGGDPRIVVRRDQLPSGLGTTFQWYPSYGAAWPSGNQWSADLNDWAGRIYDAGSSVRLDYRRLVMSVGRPLEPGTYFVGVYNSHATSATSYTIESRGIGTGQSYPVTTLSYTAGSSATITNLPPHEAAFFKVAIPAGTSS